MTNQGQEFGEDTPAAPAGAASGADRREDEGRHAEGLVHCCAAISSAVGQRRIGGQKRDATTGKLVVNCAARNIPVTLLAGRTVEKSPEWVEHAKGRTHKRNTRWSAHSLSAVLSALSVRTVNTLLSILIASGRHTRQLKSTSLIKPAQNKTLGSLSENRRNC